jgi:surface carbohydrate biosynthesis protein
MTMTTADLTRTVYLSVENKQRELASRMLIARSLCHDNVQVVIGQQWLLNRNLSSLPPGIVLFKGCNAVQAHNMRVASQAGHLCMAIDEEGPGVCDPYLLARDIDRSAQVSRVYTYTDWHAAMFDRIYGAGTAKATGNPRFDLLDPPMYENAVAAIREKHGRFVLINTNSAATNSAFGDEIDYKGVLESIGWIRPHIPADMDYFNTHLEHDRGNGEALTALVRALPGGQTNTKIIIRPHPAERPETWIARFAGLGHVEVVADGGLHIPWLLAAEVMVHTSCTTGLEAHLMGAPSICLRTGHEWDEHYTSSRINPAHSVDEAVRMIAEGKYGAPRPKYDRQAHVAIANDIVIRMGQDMPALKLAETWMDRNDYFRQKMTATTGDIEMFLGDRFRVEELGDSIFVVRASWAKASAAKAA